MIDWSSCPAVERDPARVSGAWVFRGTRVPVSALFENLEDDTSLHDFIEWFPGVSTEQARAVLGFALTSHVTVLIEQEDAVGTPADELQAASEAGMANPMVGMWADREDMVDVHAYVRKLREPRHGRDGARRVP